MTEGTRQRLFVRTSLSAGATVDLDPAQTNYLVNVLRMAPGERLPAGAERAANGELTGRFFDLDAWLGARLQADQAEADKRVAQANAEKRRAMAVAAEQEFIARVQENRAKVVEAEAQVPLAMAEALRGGNLGVMDLYRLKNIEADTRMRANIGREDDPATKEQKG